MTAKKSDTCKCLAWPPRKRFPGHHGTCTRTRQIGKRFGTYCQGCTRRYLCTQCKHNAVPGNVADRVCDECQQTRCDYPFADSAEHRYGYVCQVHGQTLQVSTVMAPSSRFLRYFHAEVVRSNQDFELHPKRMTRFVWKDAT